MQLCGSPPQSGFGGGSVDQLIALGLLFLNFTSRMALEWVVTAWIDSNEYLMTAPLPGIR